MIHVASCFQCNLAHLVGTFSLLDMLLHCYKDSSSKSSEGSSHAIDNPDHKSFVLRQCGGDVTLRTTIHGCCKNIGEFIIAPRLSLSYSCDVVDRASCIRRQNHPKSIHAQILGTVLLKTRIMLPRPPTAAEYIIDFETAVAGNAPPGAFGHRTENEWNALYLYIRTRVAHAKLIQSIYGVISPESCANCRKRGTACMVYQ